MDCIECSPPKKYIFSIEGPEEIKGYQRGKWQTSHT